MIVSVKAGQTSVVECVPVVAKKLSEKLAAQDSTRLTHVIFVGVWDHHQIPIYLLLDNDLKLVLFNNLSNQMLGTQSSL